MTVPGSSTTLAFPTDQANRQKLAKKQYKQSLEDQGLTKEEIKEMTKRKAQKQEAHYDDCGSDTTAIEEEHSRHLLALPHGNLDDAVAFSFFDDVATGQIEDTSWEEQLREPCTIAYLLGSAVEDDHPEYLRKSRYTFDLDGGLDNFYTRHQGSRMLLMEVFGGESGCTKIAIKMRMPCGKNVDLVTGVDLTIPANQAKLKADITRYEPLVLIGAPPCTAFGKLAKINRLKNPEAYKEVQRDGLILAKLMAELCAMQMDAGRYWVVENPEDSDLFGLECFLALSRKGGGRKVLKVKFPQCKLGLKNPEGTLGIQKWTELWSNVMEVIDQFVDIQCDCAAHASMVGTYHGRPRSQYAQIWPFEMCRKIVEGICNLVNNLQKEQACLIAFEIDIAIATSTFVVGSKRGRPRKYPEGAEFDCPACKSSRPWTDPRHTRNDEPPECCKHAGTDPPYECPACRNGLSPDHPNHTRITGDCRMPGTRTTGQRRRGGPVRDPAIPASGTAADRNPLSHDMEFDSTAKVVDVMEQIRAGINPNASNVSQPTTDASGASSSETFGPNPMCLKPLGEGSAASPREENEDEVPTNSDDDEDKGDLTLAPATARERRLAEVTERRRKTTADAAGQSDSSAVEDWRALDVRKCMAALASKDPAVRKKAIQRLHVRWWHAPTEHLIQTLKVSGAPPYALADVPAVVQGCLVCRDWHKPGPGAKVSYRLILEFNEEVQFDLMFYRSLIQTERGQLTIVHLVDACVKFSGTRVVKSKEEIELTKAISETWVWMFGPMSVLVLDEETGMRGQHAFDWALANRIELKFKAPNQKAWIAERGNELIRQALHKTESQMLKEDLRQSQFESTLAIVTFMKNALTVINKSTPYNAVLGKQHAMLPPLEEGASGQITDQNRAGTCCKHDARVREIAAVNIIEGNAKERIARANRHNTRPAAQLSDYKIKDQVDIWFDPSNKDMKGWRGPGTVCNVQPDEGNLEVRMQGRTLLRGYAQVRPHIAFFIYICCISFRSSSTNGPSYDSTWNK